jgi:hypothetical protein
MNIFDISRWQVRSMISAGINVGQNIYIYIIGEKNDGFFNDPIRIGLTKDEYKNLETNYTKDDINIEALKKGFLAFEKHDNVVHCSRPASRCNDKCVLYDKCTYCIYKKLRNK